MCLLWFKQEVLGESLVRDFLFDSDWWEDAQLPSPNQLRYKILIKNKKIYDMHTLQSAITPPTTNTAPYKHRVPQLNSNIDFLFTCIL